MAHLSLLLGCIAACATPAVAIRALNNVSSGAIAHAATSCGYIKPEDAPASQGYPGMEKLTDPSHDVLFYAYGPMFEGRGQIGAWKYNPHTQYLEFWYSKARCMDMCSNCCGDGGNEPGVLSVPLNPSAVVSWFQYKLEKKFKEGSSIETAFGKVELVTTPTGAWRLKDPSNGCYLDHVYACSQSEFVAKHRDADGEACPKSSGVQNEIETHEGETLAGSDDEKVTGSTTAVAQEDQDQDGTVSNAPKDPLQLPQIGSIRTTTTVKTTSTSAPQAETTQMLTDSRPDSGASHVHAFTSPLLLATCAFYQFIHP